MRGMDRTTGKPVDGVQHLQQSISDILTTPVGSRVMRRDYGSLLPELIDQPFHAGTRIRLFAATAAALMQWEPRIKVDRVAMALGDTPGAVLVTVEGTRTDTPVPTATRVTVPLTAAA
jgi:phage baseplate assembly protein W